MAEIRWHPRARRVLAVLDDRRLERLERAVDRIGRFPRSGTPMEGVNPHLRRVLAGAGRTAWSVSYTYEATQDRVIVIALGPPGVPVLRVPD